MKSYSQWTSISISLLVGLSLLVGIVAPVYANNDTSPYVPPYNLNGQPFNEWTQEWWNWAFSTNAAPAFQTGNPVSVNCMLGKQEKKVIFLAGGIGTSYDTTAIQGIRSCTIPGGMTLVIPLINYMCIKSVPYETDPALTCQLSSNGPEPTAHEFANHMDSAWFKIDSNPQITVISQTSPYPSPYRIFNANFRIKIQKGNANGATALGLYNDASADGYWIVIPPLPYGDHTIQFGGSAKWDPYFAFRTNIEYQIFVDPAAMMPGEPPSGQVDNTSRHDTDIDN